MQVGQPIPPSNALRPTDRPIHSVHPDRSFLPHGFAAYSPAACLTHTRAQSSHSADSALSEHDFHDLADSTLDHLLARFEVFLDEVDVEGSDIEYQSGVLTLRLGRHGTYVINKQTPNRQIWLSSPVSGPVRYDWQAATSTWVYHRDGHEMMHRLQSEIEGLTGAAPALID